MVYEISSLKETEKLAKKIAKNIVAYDTILLRGDIGAGKTTITSLILKNLGVKTDVVSPTFALVWTHKGKIGQINHFDLYRVEKVDELMEVGFDELIANGTNFIEWPELVKDKLKNFKEIFIEKFGDTKRRVTLWF